MMLIISGILACALFEKQTVVQGEEPSGENDLNLDTGASTDTGTTNTDTNTENNDTGTGPDTGSGEDTGPTNNMNSNNSDLAQSVDCNGDYSAYDYDNASECFTDFISCGDQILVSTGGGTDYYDNDTYVSWFAMNSKDAEYTGSERAYYFQHPGDGTSITVTLESPCEDTDLWYFKSYDMGDCYESSCSPCQQDNATSDESFHLTDSVEIYDSNPNSYFIIAESLSGNDVPFVLTVECN
jgi:hypothetical protein